MPIPVLEIAAAAKEQVTGGRSPQVKPSVFEMDEAVQGYCIRSSGQLHREQSSQATDSLASDPGGVSKITVRTW